MKTARGGRIQNHTHAIFRSYESRWFPFDSIEERADRHEFLNPRFLFRFLAGQAPLPVCSARPLQPVPGKRLLLFCIPCCNWTTCEVDLGFHCGASFGEIRTGNFRRALQVEHG